MKASTWIKGTFVFLAGGVVGATVVLLMNGDLLADAPPPPPAPRVLPTESTARTFRGSNAHEVGPDADDESLAGHLEQARFDSDWQRVIAVSLTLRERKERQATATPVQAGVEPAVPPGEKPSLVAINRTLRQRSFLKGLETRDNPARRAAREGTPEEQARQLRQLFLAPITTPADAVTRADAAYYLAAQATDDTRGFLLRTLNEPDPVRARLSAEAMARVDNADMLRALGKRLARDPEPKVRLLIASALGKVAAPAPLAAAALAQACVDEREQSVRILALQGLARCELQRDERLQQVIQRLLQNDTEELPLRRAAVGTLRAYRQVNQTIPAKLLQALERLLESSEPELLRDAAAALGEAGRDVTPLEAALATSREPATRAALEGAIQAIKTRVTR
jgi:hypothetical protein